VVEVGLLQELLILSEASKEKNLLGLKIDDKLITDKTKDEPWPGYFSCSYNQLTSLDGAPASVGGGFGCSYNQLTSLEGAPSSVGGSFSCHNNELTSLEGSPASVGGYFVCNNNELTSLEGSPASVGGSFACYYNQLTSLEGIHKILKSMNGTFYTQDNPLKSHVLGLLLVKGCKKVELDNKVVQEVLNRYLPNNRGAKAVIEAQSELLDLDLEEFAQL
jgi:hypothetical protein